MSGFAITLDAILAIMVAGLVVTASMQMLSSKEYKTDDYLLRYSYDFLAVAEKSGVLDEAIAGNISNAKAFVESVPESMCVELELYDSSWERLYHEQNYRGQNHLCKDPESFTMASRVILYDDKAYPTTLQLWYK